ncbi:MAG: AMIN domain-containing protein [Cyanothece sp. SIO1E1]|nr:AMIN domain-containing protein [Cyanothece sp. SIO1E1]
MNNSRTGIWLTGIVSFAAVQPAWANPEPATTVREWLAQINQASIVEITGIQLNLSEQGIEIFLEADTQLASPNLSTAEDALIIDIPNTRLELPDEEMFEAFEPADGIASVSVRHPRQSRWLDE